MKNLRRSGPFAERPYFEAAEIEEICREALSSVGLYPAEPRAIRIDRFIEKRFAVDPVYEELPKGVLGYTEFGPNGVQRVVISRALDDEGSQTAERRIRTTLAHEGGHGLLHAHLFALGARGASLFGEGMDPRRPKIMCREEGPAEPGRAVSRSKSYDGRWWEYQANQAIGGLLLPRPLVERSVSALTEERGSFGRRTLSASCRAEAVSTLTDVFNVNAAVAKIRLEELYPAAEDAQLTL
jgi:hypothetical protein